MAISFYTLSLLFESCRLSEFTLAGPHFTILFALFSVTVQFEPVFVVCHHFCCPLQLFQAPGEEVGGYSTNVYTCIRRLSPEIQPLTLLYTIFHEKGTPFVNLLFKQQKTFSVFAWPDINTRGVGRIRDEVEGLHNRREFFQRLECLYQAMQTQEKSFLLLL